MIFHMSHKIKIQISELVLVLVLVVVTVLFFSSLVVAQGPTPIINPTAMIMMNGGNYIDIGEPITSWSGTPFNSIVNSSGDLLYMFNADRLGKMMGRFSVAKRWEWWTGDRWNGTPNTTATTIDHTVGSYQEMAMIKHPDIPNGLIGVANQFYKVGGVWLDTHGHLNNFIFDGTKFTQWQSEATYSQFITSPLISSWNGTSFVGSSPAFAFDSVSRKGLVIGTVGHVLGNFNSQLTAVEYRLDDVSQKWHRWNVNNWYSNASWPGQTNITANRNVFILNPNIDVTKFKTNQPLITNIPNTANYFITFNYTDIVTNMVKRGAAFYQDSNPPVWSWWNGSAWQVGGTYDFQDIRGATLPEQGKPVRQIYWTGGKISIFFNDNGNITEIVYDNNTKTFSSPIQVAQSIAGTDSSPSFVIARDSTEKLWLVYAYPDFRHVKVKSKNPNTGVWTDSNLTYQNLNADIQPLGINFITTSQIPIFFIRQGNRLALIAEDTPFWDSEVSYIPEAPVQNVMLNDAELIWQKEFTAYARGQSYGSHPGPIALDAAGYIYAPNFPTSNVVVIPPGSTGPEDNKTWGGFWDHFRHPRGIAIDNIRSKVYIADKLLTGGSAGMETNGQVLIWNLAKRTDNVGYRTFGNNNPLPAGTDRNYRPQVLTNFFVWPSDTAVDEARGLLYVTNSAKSKIDVFDIKNNPVFIYSFGSEGKNPGQFQFPQGLDLDTTGNLYIVDSENHRIQKFVYDQITARQVYSTTWGQLGSKLSVPGDVRFRYPVDIAVDDTYGRIYITDPMNKRITVLDLNGNFIYQWTDWPNKQSFNFNPELKSGITVDDKGMIYVAIDTQIVKFKVPDNPPVVTLNSHRERINAGEEFNITGNVTDDWGTLSVDLIVNGQVVETKNLAKSKNTTFSFNWNSNQVGSFNVQIKAKDLIAQEAEQTFTIITTQNSPTSTNTTPPNGAVMAQDNSGLGWKLVVFTFSASLSSNWNDLANYSISSTLTTPLTIASIGGVSTRQIIILSRNMIPGERITITHKPSNSYVCLGFLPGDVNGDGRTQAHDITVLNGLIGTTEGLAQPLYKTDINRDGVFNFADVTRIGEFVNVPNWVFRLSVCPAPLGLTINQSQLASIFSALRMTLNQLSQLLLFNQ